MPAFVIDFIKATNFNNNIIVMVKNYIINKKVKYLLKVKNIKKWTKLKKSNSTKNNKFSKIVFFTIRAKLKVL